ncbi:hypothetical protein ABH931_006143 [Streptacidiphilus sp. MAP12-33]
MATATVQSSTSTRGMWNSARARAAAALTQVKRSAQESVGRLAPSALTIAGLGCIDTGVFQANTIAGWIATGISLLILEYRIDGT